MSNIVTRPSAGRSNTLKRKLRTNKSGWLRVYIQTDTLAPRIINEYLDFLTLVYGTYMRSTQKNLSTTMFSFPLQDRTEAGLRVASRLYGVNYETTIL